MGMEKKKKMNSTYTTNSEKAATSLLKPTSKVNGNDWVYSFLDAILMDWNRIK